MTPKPDPLVIGWREPVDLPELGLGQIAAKIDTGARTSALHATDVDVFEQAGQTFVRFGVPHAGLAVQARCVAPVVDRRMIKNTSGQPEDRLIIQTLLVLAGRRWRIDVSLADRGAMAYPLILGRTAVRGHRLLINPGRSNMTVSARLPAGKGNS